MPSFQLITTPSRRAAARHISKVRRAIQMAFAREAESGLTQSEIARRLNVHRSVINRELRGQRDITHGRVGELAYAMGYEPVFELRKVEPAQGSNLVVGVAQEPEHRRAVTTSSNATWPDAESTIVIHRAVQAVA